MKPDSRPTEFPAFALRRAAICSVAFIAMAGCGVVERPASVPGSVLTGQIMGGQQPVAGARIMLYAAGLTGNGTGAVDLFAVHVVTSNSNGQFTFPSDYVCPSSTTPVYLVARGGNPGLSSGTNNAALVLTAALGDCGNLTPSAFVTLNELTTVASAWALAQFYGSGALIGASSSNLTGLRNAFASAATLVDTTRGIAPGSFIPAGAKIEVAKLNTLADVLAPCVNSDGGAACNPLFSASTVAGVAPTNVLDAALNIVRNPAANVAAVFNVAQPNPPFQSPLSAAPNDWTLSVTYTGGGLNVPGALAIDSTGNVWVANYSGAAVSKFSTTGVPAAANGFHGAGLLQSYGIAIDPFDNAWVTNEQSVTGAQNTHLGSISKFNSSGIELSGPGYTGGGVYYPAAIASDPAGQIWVADYGNSSATLLANNGTALSSANGYAPSMLPFTTAVAIDAGRNAWFAAQGGAYRVTPLGVVSSFACCNNPAGIAIDQSGNVWVADYGSFSIAELSSSGALVARTSTASALVSAQGIAIDGMGNVWAGNYYGNSITALTGATAALRSPVAGLGRDASLNEPYGLAIDASGNLWFSNAGNDTITQIVGLASPVKTPLLGPPIRP